MENVQTKEVIRTKLQQDTEAFLNAGGEIEVLAPEQRSNKRKSKRKHVSKDEREASYQDFLKIATEEYKEFIGAQ